MRVDANEVLSSVLIDAFARVQTRSHAVRTRGTV